MTVLTFPNESNDNRAARNALLEAEIDLRSRVEEVAQMRRALPTGGEAREDYLFVEAGADGQTRDVRLSDLKEFHRVIISNGAMPMAILERVIDNYIETKLAGG